MIFWTIVLMSMRSLAANKLRSILAMLGIIMGVWSVISALALAAGAQKKVMDQMSSLGTNVVMVLPGQRGTGGVISGSEENLTVADAMALLRIGEVSRSAPVVRGAVQAKHGDKNTRPSLLGTAPTYFAIHNFQPKCGRILTDEDCDAEARVAVIGPSTAEKLFGNDIQQALGQMIEIKGVHYRVVGILQPKGDQGWFHPDDQIAIPFTTAMKQVLGQNYLDEVDLSAKDESQLSVVETKVTLMMRKLHRLAADADNDFYVRNRTEELNTTSMINIVLSLLLGGIAFITLVVGGIGVMNVMLVTVAERTREIGVRKAIGARRRDILRQFLIESVVMSATGGVIGIVLGILTARIVTAVQSYVPLVVKLPSVLLAIIFSGAVGIFFGYYPALRASKLDPIEALRYE